jgi:uncharacterized protein YbjT (DUF2867 family)
MKIVVIGGSGLIGSKLVNKLRQRGHEVVAASPASGVNTITGEGLADVALGAPVNGTVEVAGPDRVRLAELVQRFLSAKHDGREVIADVHARYFGAELNDQSLIPGDNPRIAPTRFEDWLRQAGNAA